VAADAATEIVTIGNAAGEGAVRALVSVDERDEIARVAKTITKIETATEPAFQAHFVEGLAFPGGTSEQRPRRRGRRTTQREAS
jgi:uncharacterized 2Fe-2S/4Fe-4S cluster protein (DUF4445 family)